LIDARRRSHAPWHGFVAGAPRALLLAACPLLALLLAGGGPLLALLLAGCPRAPGAASPDAGVAIDGRFADWPEGVHLQADGAYVYVRLALPEERTLQASLPLELALDPDDASGTRPPATGATGGADVPPGPALQVVFSPRTSDGQGVAVLVPGSDAHTRRAVPHAALDLVVAPTFASRTFELRIARDVRGAPEATRALAGGRVRVRATARDAHGGVAWQGPVLELDLPERGAATAAEAPDASPGAGGAAGFPPPPADGIRVVSWNVLLASPRTKPAPFARVLGALAPDVVLLQEWDGATADELAAWFANHVPSPDAAWRAVVSAGWGVALVARGPLEAVGPARVPRPVEAPADPRRADDALRLVAGRAETRLGPVCAASLHLKCCGAADGAQEAQRRAEARLASETLRVAFAGSMPCVRVVGGDLNLVGSDVPLELLRIGLDAGGGALAIADTPVLGDRATYTWLQPWSRFAPGRLDWVLHGTETTSRAFALDPRRLDDETLARAGLERDDGAASDHLPLVVDLRRTASR